VIDNRVRFILPTQDDSRKLNVFITYSILIAE